MGRILKAVYTHIYDKSNNEKNYFSNGIPMAVVKHIEKKYIKEETEFNPFDLVDQLKKDSSIPWEPCFNIGNFHYYFQNNVGQENIIPVSEIKDDGNSYIFPIEIGTTVDRLVSTLSIDLDGQRYDYTIKEILEPVIDHLRANRLKIVICNIQDPCHDCPQARELELILKDMGISESNLVFIFGNKFLTHSKMYPDSKVNFTYGNLALQQQARAIDDFPRQTSMGYTSDLFRETDLDKNKLRPKKFLCFNRSMRNHRYYLAYMAMKYNLLDHSIFSFVNIPHDKESIKQMIEHVAGPITNEEIDKLMSLLPYELDTDHLTPDQKRGFVTDNNKKEWYEDTYFHITSETSVYATHEDEPFFSEKTFRPISNLQPFIFVGDYGSLRQLKNLGFKTFHPYIDESYDLVEDPNERLRLIEKEILKLNSMSQQELHDLYYSMVDILIFNKNHFYSFKNTNPYSRAYEFIKQL